MCSGFKNDSTSSLAFFSTSSFIFSGTFGFGDCCGRKVQAVCHESAPMRQFCRISVLYCIEDEGSPLGLVIQVMIPNHHKLLWSKATVVSVMGKGEA